MRLLITACVLLGLLCLGCSGGGGANGTSHDLTGTWEFDYGEGETYTHQLVSTGGGNYNIHSNGQPDGTASIAGSNVTMLTGDAGDPLTITGIYSPQAGTITGSCSTAFNETFAFQATRQ